jgi:dTDP-4-amino-4,6-dideoxygalactose transaminase
MLRKSNFRFNSLYFSSVGLKESLLIFLAILISPFKDIKQLRKELHKNYSNFFYKKDVFSYSSARSSLYACLRASGIKQGDEVVLTSFTCLAVPTAVLASGAIPKYCDINPFTLDIDLKSLKQNITNKTKAVILQHTLGLVSNISEVKEIIKDKEIVLIEDCALSMGSAYKGSLLGTMGDASIFSLELSKTLSSGWGGILVVNNKTLAKAVAKEYKQIGELNYFKSLRMAIQLGISGILYHPNIYPIGKYIISFMFRARIF